MPKTIPSELNLCEGTCIELRAVGAEKGARKFTMLAYTGAPVETWFGRMIVDLSGMAVGKQKKPILRNHDGNQIAGYSESVTKSGRDIQIEGQLSNHTQAGIEVAELSDEGFPWEASIGFRVQRVEEIRAGDSKTVNGREFAGPGMIVTKSKLRESSFVSNGADESTSGVALSAGVNSQDITVQEKETDMPDPKPIDPVAEFQGKHPDAVEKWKTEGAATEMARFAELVAQYADRPKFVLDQFGKGNGVNDARFAFAEILQAELTEAKKANEKLAKESTELQQKLAAQDGSDGVAHAERGKGDAPAGELSFEDTVKKEWSQNVELCKDEFESFDGFMRYRREEERIRLLG